MTDAIAARLELLAQLGEALARRRDDLVESQGEDIGAPCTLAGLEVDLAVDHLKTMAAEVPQVAGQKALRHGGRHLSLRRPAHHAGPGRRRRGAGRQPLPL